MHAHVARSLLLCSLLAACGESPEPQPLGVHRNGLVPLGQILQPTPSPHLAELVSHQDRYVYVANSNDTIAVYELLPTTTPEPSFDDPLSDWSDGRVDGSQPGLALVLDQVEVPELLRCTTLALHSASASLYCGDETERGIVQYDLTDPRAPQLREGIWQPDNLLATRDLLVVDDRLLLARYDRGLAWTTIDAHGQLGELREHELAANVRMLAASAQHVWVLTADRGLRLLDRQTLAEQASLALPGPALDLSSVGERAIVGLGSAGARIIEWTGEALEQVEAMHPPGVVTAVDLHGDAAAVVTLTGAWLYDLRASVPESITADPANEAGSWSTDEPRLAGFRAAGSWVAGERAGAMLYARFIADSLVVSDWTWIERFAIDLDGFPTGVDLASGAYVPAEADEIPLLLRNPGGVRQEVEVFSVHAELLDRFELGPFATELRHYPAERFEIDVPELLTVRIRDRGGIAARVSTVVLRRPPVDQWPIEVHGEPAPGQPFPAVVLGTTDADPTVIEPLPLPVPGQAQRIVFYGSDCVAMWPEIDDLVSRVHAGELDPASVILAANDNVSLLGVVERWRLDGVTWGFFDPEDIGPALVEMNPWANIYEQGFELRELPSAANHPTDYELDADGRVIAVERQYRGAYPLFPAALE